MTHVSETILHELRIRIDRTLCVGFGDCVTLAPSLFALDEDGIAVFLDPDPRIEPDRILDACRACPVDALTVTAADGRQLAP
jgi:ferredoxin